MFTQKEKNFLVGVWKQVMPGGKTREEVRDSIELIDQIQK